MKPTVAADEMFPEGVGPYMDLEEVGLLRSIITFLFCLNYLCIFKIIYFKLQAGGPSNLLMDLAANEKAVHADFFNGN